MIELLAIIGVVVAMVKIASADGQSSVNWGCLTIVICLVCLAIPLPIIRVGVGLGLSFAAMTVYKIAANR